MIQVRGCLILLLVSAVWVVPGTAQEAVDLPFHLSTPEGWRTETIPFPLEFAPELEYEGLEELRFAPGMFKEESVDFWSYAFVWWVPEGTRFGTERLQKDLERYFRGLTTAVAEAREFDAGGPDYEVQLELVESSSPDHALWVGEVLTFDVFTTRKPIRLNTSIELIPCSAQGHVAAVFLLSPQPQRHQIWEVLNTMRQDFRCEL